MRKSWALLPLLVAGCMSGSPEPQGSALFAENCAVCHGVSGKGDGALSSDMAVAPADLTKLAVNNGGVFPMERVITQIHGYPGRFESGAMPEFGPIFAGEEVDWVAPDGRVVPTPAPLLAIARYLESIQEG